VKRLLVYLRDYAYALHLMRSSLGWWRKDDRYLGGELAPVVLLPGVYEPWTFLRPLAERINATGHPVHVVRGLGRNTRSIRRSAAIAQDYVDRAGLTGVILVAHSKGGLIGKHMMLVDDRAGRIDRLVAIATPFGGSSYANYMLVPALRAFRSKNRTMAMLVKEERVNARITSVYGEFDTHIPEGCALPGATNIEFPVSGHFRVLADKELLAAVDAAIAAPA
jgi:hypothetical protein